MSLRCSARTASAVSRISRSPLRKTRTSPRPSRSSSCSASQIPLDLVALDDSLDGVGHERAIAHLDRIGAAGDLDHRRALEVSGEPRGIDGRRGDDDPEVRPPRQQLTEIAEEEVDRQAALVGLVDDQSVVLGEQSVVGDLREQHPIGHDLDQGVLAGPVGEPNLISDHRSQGSMQLLGHPFGDRARGDPARLRVPDQAVDPPPELEADLGQLRGLARAGLAGDDDDLVVADRLGDVVATLADRQIRVGHLGDELTSTVELLRGEGHGSASLGAAHPCAHPCFG